MDREQMIRIVRENMPERRWKHTLGVMETSVILARLYGEDENRAETAAILHDVCKFWPVEKQAETVRESGTDTDVLDFDKELWHAHAGAWIAAKQFGVEDEEVLNAIRYHTSGREDMSKLEKIVCLADYIEPSRDFPGVDAIRKLAETSLEQALIAGFDSTISFLLAKGKRIYPLTVLTRNRLIRELEV
ncbi:MULTISPECIES: bis(5'-nucleosyl)-tetraphosphatase (symmetrical) YqeK [Paenibacillus]|uniref:bis(5'-nucleosyl)-tetraphosphatase (symmetrical) n=1 Tax=Paenibacillus lutrae TaxID=2078573 RepID=A0A7X3JZ18_9BACL|nr:MULTISPECIES: bis(5'-nucleosyl)-tetraphosphatase (symmetrical) YqeK [Paenibacillus]MVO99495.1 HD domain-containing protein [Paenibacillus lutrae]